MGYGGAWDDPADKKESSPVPSPDAAEDKPFRMCTDEDREQWENAMPDSPEPEQKAKEPTPGQVVEMPASGNIDDAKFKEIKEVETLVPVSSKPADRTPGYSFGNHPPISKQERGGSGQVYMPAVTERRLREAPGRPVGRVLELAPGGSGGGDAPGGSGAGGAAGGSGATGGSGGVAGGGSGPAPV